MLSHYKNYWLKYFDFTGFATRGEFWTAVLFNSLIWAALITAGYFVTVIAYIDMVLMLAFIIPSLSIFWRRMKDTGRSGWNILWILIPIVGFIFVLVFLADRTKKRSVEEPKSKEESVKE